MRIALIASPFITVPPARYGGTELFTANLAEALIRLGVDVTVYTNGESTVKADVRWRYPNQDWPLAAGYSGLDKELDHAAWAVEDAQMDCDIIHVNSATTVPFSRFSTRPFVCTMHHPKETELTGLYERYTDVTYVSISRHQAANHPTVPSRVIHHGLDLSRYRFQARKQPYLCFLGRICPIKGTHNAIEIAKQAGLPLKIAGEVQPMFREYFDAKIRPHIDGRNVEFLGEADLALKNELLGNATALLFPIEWEEPFGLVMIEAMACGTPVIAFPGGAVEEIVANGITGRVCRDIRHAARTLQNETFDPQKIRRSTEKRFSADAMARQYLQLYAEVLGGVEDSMHENEEAAA